MNLSPAGITAVNGFVAGLAGGWSGNTDAAVLAAIDAPAVANPATRGTVPAGYTVASVMALLSSQSIQNLRTFPALYQLMGDIQANNSANVLVAVEFLVASADIQSSEGTAIAAAVNATVPDPSWQATVGWAQANLGRPMDITDIEEARAGS